MPHREEDDDLHQSLDWSALQKSPKKKSKKKKSARDKKRDLETRFSKSHSPDSPRAWHQSAPVGWRSNHQPSSTHHNSNRLSDSQEGSMDWGQIRSNNVNNSSINNDGSSNSRHSRNSRKSRKDRKRDKQKNGGSDDLYSYLQTNSSPTKLTATSSRQSLQSSPGPGTKNDLSRYLNESYGSDAKKRNLTSGRHSVQSTPEPRRVVQMRDTERLVRGITRSPLSRKDSGRNFGANSPQKSVPGRSPQRQPSNGGQRNSLDRSNSNRSNHSRRGMDRSPNSRGTPTQREINRNYSNDWMPPPAHDSRQRGRSMGRSNSDHIIPSNNRSQSPRRGMRPQRGQSIDRSQSNHSLSRRGQSMDRSRSNHSLSRRGQNMDQRSNHSLSRRGQSIDRSRSNHNARGDIEAGCASPQRRGRSQDRGRDYGDTQPRMRSRSGDGNGFARSRSRSRSAFGGSPKRNRSVDRSRPPETLPVRRSRARSRSSDSRRSAFSTDSFASNFSNTKVIKKGNKTIVLVPMSQEQAKNLPNDKRFFTAFGKKIEMEETPPKTLVFIWIIVFAELGFDLGATIIAFRSLLSKGLCCGVKLQLGSLPLSVTTPFFFLLIAELSFLFRAMVLTMWPSILTGQETENERYRRTSRVGFWKYCCCFLRFKVNVLLKILNFLVLLNPFFGCVIAWMLLYQSDKTEAFIVLGLEGANLILHFLSVYLEGAVKTWCGLAFHCIPLIPFFVSIILILFYLKQGGVCYSVDNAIFSFTGCELCPDDTLPVNGTCLINGTVIELNGPDGLFDIDIGANDIDSLKNDIVARSPQGEFCSKTGGPRFCFFEY